MGHQEGRQVVEATLEECGLGRFFIWEIREVAERSGLPDVFAMGGSIEGHGQNGGSRFSGKEAESIRQSAGMIEEGVGFTGSAGPDIDQNSHYAIVGEEGEQFPDKFGIIPVEYKAATVLPGVLQCLIGERVFLGPGDETHGETAAADNRAGEVPVSGMGNDEEYAFPAGTGLLQGGQSSGIVDVFADPGVVELIRLENFAKVVPQIPGRLFADAGPFCRRRAGQHLGDAPVRCFFAPSENLLEEKGQGGGQPGGGRERQCAQKPPHAEKQTKFQAVPESERAGWRVGHFILKA